MNDYNELIKKLRNAAGGDLGRKMCRDAADAIEQLARDIDVLTKERDAAVADLKDAILGDAWECFACKYINKAECSALLSGECWEWRGVRE